jgi:hypothetical protein
MEFTDYTLDQLQQLCETTQVVNNISKSRYCSDCNLDMILCDYFYACNNCGIVDDFIVYNTKYEVEYHPKPILYKRRIYWTDKLKLISVLKTSKSKKYIAAKDFLNNMKDKFKNINDLYFLMKDNGLSKFYPHIYGLWYDIKKYRLITLTYAQIDVLVNEFVEIDIKFKANNNGRKNMISYNATLYFLFKKHKIKGLYNILLPYNYRKMINSLRLLNI